MIAIVSIIKSFDGETDFTKEWTKGDFEQFFTEEGDYLDRLCEICKDKGREGEGFEVTYRVKVVK